MPVVQFSYADVPSISLPNKASVKRFIQSLFEAEGISLEYLSYVFCSDEFLLQINQDHLQHDYYTDIITFDLSAKKPGPITGEIYISTERVKENATTHGFTFKKELLRVMLHGALHLCDYKDKTKREITLMRDKEDHYLRLFEEQI